MDKQDNTREHSTETREDKMEKPTVRDTERAFAFRKGQKDRRAALPCSSANGAYLEGWYAPDKQTPPSLTEDQAFYLGI